MTPGPDESDASTVSAAGTVSAADANKSGSWTSSVSMMGAGLMSAAGQSGTQETTAASGSDHASSVSSDGILFEVNPEFDRVHFDRWAHMEDGVWLQKLGTNNRWQKRWFSLEGQTLMYASKKGGKVDKQFALDLCAAAALTGDALAKTLPRASKPPGDFPCVLARHLDSTGHGISAGRTALTLSAPTDLLREAWMSACAAPWMPQAELHRRLATRRAALNDGHTSQVLMLS